MPVSTVEIGLVMSTAGVGFVIAAGGLPKLNEILPRKSNLLGSMLVFYACCFVSWAAQFSTNPMPILLINFPVSGGAVAVFVISAASWRREIVRPDSRAQVAGIFQTLCLGIMPVGSIAGRPIGQYGSPSFAILILAVVGMAGSMLLFAKRNLK
jgi:MFS family permease